MRRLVNNSPFTMRVLCCLLVLSIGSVLCIYVFISTTNKSNEVQKESLVHRHNDHHNLPQKFIQRNNNLPNIIVDNDKSDINKDTTSEQKVNSHKDNNINLITQNVNVNVNELWPRKIDGKRFEDVVDVYNKSAPGSKYTLQCEYIDIVYTWVNGSDPLNDSGRKRRESEKKIRPLALNRVRDLMGLKYSLRSLRKHVPWVRKIFVVTDSQYPTWFNQSSTDIQFIFHKDFFTNTSHIPTFNSNGIEINFHNLPDYVSDCFLYFNDDTFVAKELPIETIYNKDKGQVLYFTTWNAPQEDTTMIKTSSWHLSIHNTNLMLDGLWGKATRPYHSHTIIFYNKQLLKLIARVFPKEFAATSNEPFRTGDNVNQGFIYSQFALRYYNTASAKRHDHYFALVDDIDKMKRAMAYIVQHRPHTVCLNDEFGTPPKPEALALLYQTFETLFPEKPSWEL